MASVHDGAAAMTAPAAPYLSIILTGRNDNFGGDFNDRLFSALRFNHRRLSDAGVRYQLVFVEWRPIAGKRLLSDLLRDEVPEIDGCLTTYEVDERYHAAFSQNPRLQFHEFIAKNVGIRRATGSYLLTTNTDIYFSREVVACFAQRMLRPMVLYRATRVDLKSGMDRSHLDDPVLKDPRNYLEVNSLKPPTYSNAAGDFLLLDRFSWHALRGFNEVYRVAKLHIDTNFCHRALGSGVLVMDSAASVYHLGTGTFQAQRSQYGPKQTHAPWGARWRKSVLYENPANWGLGDAPVSQRSRSDFRIEFDDAAVPPLVSLRGIIALQP
jgi:hypothetical protein